jgi:hypothetical protein
LLSNVSGFGQALQEGGYHFSIFQKVKSTWSGCTSGEYVKVADVELGIAELTIIRAFADDERIDARVASCSSRRRLQLSRGAGRAAAAERLSHPAAKALRRDENAPFRHLQPRGLLCSGYLSSRDPTSFFSQVNDAHNAHNTHFPLLSKGMGVLGRSACRHPLPEADAHSNQRHHGLEI